MVVSECVWIGLRKNKYQWTDGIELQYEDWNSNQPRAYTSPTAYIYLHKGGQWKWFDVMCKTVHFLF